MLNWLDYLGTDLNPWDKEYLLKTLERNAPYYMEGEQDKDG
ncbi:MAG: hypothetical protein PUH24_05585 [Prevotellaceae bacterium]|nr:hypothetical protein [Prevotellaceae bacterium]MDY6130347.1 hypothetical protein [Prevotella sp.]